MKVYILISVVVPIIYYYAPLLMEGEINFISKSYPLIWNQIL